MLLITSVTNNAMNLNNSSDFNELRSSVSSLLCYTTIPSSTIAVLVYLVNPPDTTNNTQSGDTVYADRE